ncbi:MAG: hypothetical protein GC185_07825 [Alphaproteobacteria bacterium]|nr:hypothetical protein [Alphaproteobacteria bacterium]
MADDETPDDTRDDQADGFKSSGPASGNGYIQSRGWQYWFDLKEQSRLGNWQKVEELLAKNPGSDLPYQNFVAETFHRAANQGRLDIVKTFFERGFSLPEEVGGETLKRLVVFFADKSMPVAAFLAAEGHADPQDALYAVAARGKAKTMAAFKDAGIDVLTGGSSYFLAFYGGNAEMMHYLSAQGANIYAAPVVAGLYGREKEIDANKKDDALQAYRWQLQEDRRTYANYYAYIAPTTPTMEELRAMPYGVEAEKQTLLSLAARGGFFEDVAKAAEKKGALALTAEDFLRKDAHGVSVLDIMAAHRELDKLFDPRLWHKNPAEAVKLHDALKELRAQDALEIEGFTAALRRHQLRTRKKPSPGLILKPRGK